MIHGLHVTTESLLVTSPGASVFDPLRPGAHLLQRQLGSPVSVQPNKDSRTSSGFQSGNGLRDQTYTGLTFPVPVSTWRKSGDQ